MVESHRVPPYLYQEDKQHQYESELRELYSQAKGFSMRRGFDNEEFPHWFAESVCRSLDSQEGICFKKLREKCRYYEYPEGERENRLKNTYLRITFGEESQDAPGHKYVFEVWPPGSASSKHAHAGCYAVVKVVYGEITEDLYDGELQDHTDSPSQSNKLKAGLTIYKTPALG